MRGPLIRCNLPRQSSKTANMWLLYCIELNSLRFEGCFRRVRKIAKSDYSGHKGPKEKQMYSSTFSLTSALDGVGGQRHAQTDLPPGKYPEPIVQEAGWAPEPVWTGAEYSLPPGSDPRTVQPVASRYIGWAIPVHKSDY
jgi:hypothetical protein